jgi:hypothetical protein
MRTLLLILALLLQPTPSPSLTLTPQPDGALTVAWSGAPADATVVYGKAVVGSGAAGSATIPPALAIPGRAAVLLDGAAQEVARAVTLGFSVVRDSDGPVVSWGATEYGCVRLTGINLDDMIACGTAGSVRLDAGQAQYAGVGRQVGLWGGSEWLVAPVDVPGYTTALPVVAAP